MGMRQPRDDGDDPDVIEFGIAALDARLSEAEVTFPADAGTVLRALGDDDIPYDASGNEMALSTALDRAERDTFETKQDLLNALHPVFEEKRESVSLGLLGRVRALVPF